MTKTAGTGIHGGQPSSRQRNETRDDLATGWVFQRASAKYFPMTPQAVTCRMDAKPSGLAIYVGHILMARPILWAVVLVASCCLTTAMGVYVVVMREQTNRDRKADLVLKSRPEAPVPPLETPAITTPLSEQKLGTSHKLKINNPPAQINNQVGHDNSQDNVATVYCAGSANCSGVNKGIQQYNQFGAPHPPPDVHILAYRQLSGVTWDAADDDARTEIEASPSAATFVANPGMELTVGFASDFDHPAIQLTCDPPCKVSKISVRRPLGSSMGSEVGLGYSTVRSDWGDYIKLRGISELASEERLIIRVRSNTPSLISRVSVEGVVE